MNPELLAQWRSDAAVMREFLRSREWAVLKRHLEVARDEALRTSDQRLQPDQVEQMIHYRAVRLGIMDALTLPETIVRQAETVEASVKADAARRTSRVQRGPR